MSVTVRQILGLLQAAAPQELALSWDNVGLLVDAGKPVDSVLTALDITPAVVREAVENDCQLIVSHHPVIFQPIKSLAADDVPALLMKTASPPSACTPISMRPRAASMIRFVRF